LSAVRGPVGAAGVPPPQSNPCRTPPRLGPRQPSQPIMDGLAGHHRRRRGIATQAGKAGPARSSSRARWYRRCLAARWRCSHNPLVEWTAARGFANSHPSQRWCGQALPLPKGALRAAPSWSAPWRMSERLVWEGRRLKPRPIGDHFSPETHGSGHRLEVADGGAWLAPGAWRPGPTVMRNVQIARLFAQPF